MVRIDNKKECSGCGACVYRCPKNCIIMREDNEGFLYPMVNEDDCIGCGLCEKVCHEQHPYPERMPLQVCAGYNKDEEVRMDSSSGGIFYILAEKTITEGGVVFGTRFDEQWQVVIDYAETLDDVRSFMGSKYVQARTATAYRDAETFLRQGRKVLFSGSPCQIAGLHHYLRRQYENLITVDFVCHGVPSPKVWGRYLREVVGASLRINDIKFRNKDNGWKQFNFVIDCSPDSGQVSMSSFYYANQYMQAFLSNMILRPSCHECRAKQGRSHSDITIADFWGIGELIPEMDDDKGTGLIIVNSSKGMAALDKDKMIYGESTLEAASKYNAGLFSFASPHPKRERFFSRLDKVDSVTGLIEECLRPPFCIRLRKLYGRLRRRVYTFLLGKRGG